MDPKSAYALELGVCITLCDVCHHALHGEGHWGQLVSDPPRTAEELVRLVQRLTKHDIWEEREWRQREQWGAWVQALRKTTELSQRKLAQLAGVSLKTVQYWETGRYEPRLLEAKRLAKVLGISLDDLASEHESGDWWVKDAEDRSALRALVFRGRQAKQGEILDRGALLVWEKVGRDNDERENARQAAREREAASLREWHRNHPPVLLGCGVLAAKKGLGTGPAVSNKKE